MVAHLFHGNITESHDGGVGYFLEEHLEASPREEWLGLKQLVQTLLSEHCLHHVLHYCSGFCNHFTAFRYTGSISMHLSTAAK